MADIYDPLGETDDLGKQKALADAIRGRMAVQQQQANQDRAWGNLGMLSGDKVLGNFGQAQIQGAEQADRSVGQQQEHMLVRAVEAARQKSQDLHAREMERQGRQSLEQGKFSLSNPAYGQPVVINNRTGEVKPFGEAQPRPERGVSATETEKQFEAFRKAISSTEGRGHIAVPLQQSINRAEAVETLIRDPKTGLPLNLIPGQVREAATGLAQVIQQGGQPALQQIEEMTPHTMAGRFANAKQYLMNQPEGAEAQAFLTQMLDTLAREKATALSQVRKAQLQNIPAFAHLRKADKNRFESMMTATGIDPANIDENGLLIQPPAGGDPGSGHPDGAVGKRTLPDGSVEYKMKDGTIKKGAAKGGH